MKEKDESPLNQVLISLGSNLDPEFNILEAFRLLDKHVHVLKKAPIFQTKAVGSEGPDYLNSAVLVQTVFDLTHLRKQVLSSIEDQLGRIRSADKYIDRTIDLDVLIFNQIVTDQEIWTQAHIAIPSAHILPDFTNPETGETISQSAVRLLSGADIEIRPDLV